MKANNRPDRSQAFVHAKADHLKHHEDPGAALAPHGIAQQISPVQPGYIQQIVG